MRRARPRGKPAPHRLRIAHREASVGCRAAVAIENGCGGSICEAWTWRQSVGRDINANYMTPPQPSHTPPARPGVLWWLTAGIAFVLLAGYAFVAYFVPRTADGLADALSGYRVDGCCQRAPSGSQVQRAGQPIAGIVQVGTAPPNHLMLLAPRIERGTAEPDTSLVGRLASTTRVGPALVVDLVPRDSVTEVTPAATIVLGPQRRLIPVYRR